VQNQRQVGGDHTAPALLSISASRGEHRSQKSAIGKGSMSGFSVTRDPLRVKNWGMKWIFGASQEPLQLVGIHCRVYVQLVPGQNLGLVLGADKRQNGGKGSRLNTSTKKRSQTNVMNERRVKRLTRSFEKAWGGQ